MEISGLILVGFGIFMVVDSFLSIKMNLYRPYKGKGYQEQRAGILEAIEMIGS